MMAIMMVFMMTMTMTRANVDNMLIRQITTVTRSWTMMAMLTIPVNDCGSASVAVVWPNVQVPKVSDVNQKFANLLA